MTIYTCCDNRRRDAVRAQKTYRGVDFNGIDYLEVQDGTTLLLHFIHPLKAAGLSKENVQINGGERIQDIEVVSIEEGREKRASVLSVTVNKAGDAAAYTLSLSTDPRRLVLDPQLSAIDFTFHLADISFDCQQEPLCLPAAQPVPIIDYMAKDYNSFRQLMFDRLSFLIPQWQERSPADVGVMLVELLAYVGDYLSYRQDVIATESTLNTARRRISARRHARLLDYHVNDGCNARAWVQIQVNQDIVADNSDASVLPADTQLLTQVAGLERAILPFNSVFYAQAISSNPTIFEPMMNIDSLYVAHNQMLFYTWGVRECCLPQGSTSATLRGSLPNLKPGDVLIFKEMVDPGTGAEEDAEPTHRCAVRLTAVKPDTDPLGTWPVDQSSTAEPAGKVIAEYRIVEEDRLLVEEAVMSSKRSGQHIEKVEERVDNETRTVVQRYVIEKPDKETLTVEVRIRQSDRKVEVQLFERGHAVQEEQEVEEVREEQETETVREKKESHHERTAKDEETEEPTQKLPGLPQLHDQSIDVADMDTIEFVVPPQAASGKSASEASRQAREEHKEQRHEAEKDRQEHDEKHESRTRKVRVYRIITEPDYALPVTEIVWGYEDALPFPLCISATTDYGHGHRYIEDVSVVLGNIVLADHGGSVAQGNSILVPDTVPNITMNWATTTNQQCQQSEAEAVSPRYYPRLQYSPLTFACSCDTSDLTLSAAALTTSDAGQAIPAITLFSSDSGNFDANLANSANLAQWQPQLDLLSSSVTDRYFTVEVEADGSTFLRFGDDVYGQRPAACTHFSAHYRIGNGSAGNIGRDALYHLATSNQQLQQAVTAINNPMPALGGVDAESMEDIRQHAAGSLTEQARGVTPQDYITLARQDAQVHRANAILRWTGSWYTVFLVVERVGGLPVDDTFKQQVRQRLEQYRMVGTDLVIVSPAYVPLDIAMNVTVQAGYIPRDVQDALLKAFNNQQWPDGNRGVFYPDNFGFGQPVYLNPLYVAAIALPGVQSVDITTFQRQGIPGTGLSDGVLPMTWQELAILENNPLYPERGLFRLSVTAGMSEVLYG